MKDAHDTQELIETINIAFQIIVHQIANISDQMEDVEAALVDLFQTLQIDHVFQKIAHIELLDITVMVKDKSTR